MSSPLTGTPFGRKLVAGVCTTALVLGPTVGVASASDDSLAKTFTERSQQVSKRDKQLRATLKTLQAKPSVKGAKSAAKDSAALYRTTEALRTEVRDDDGSTDKGVQARDAVLPKLTLMAASAKKLDRVAQSTAKKRKVTKALVQKVVTAKLALDKVTLDVITAFEKAIKDDGPIDPAPAPTDPTV